MLLFTHSPQPCTINSQSSAGQALGTTTGIQRDGDFVGVLKKLGRFVGIDFSHIFSLSLTHTYIFSEL